MKPSVIIELDNPTALVYMNVYEDGDRWEKIKGCGDCPDDVRGTCCGNCFHLQKDMKCRWSVEGAGINGASRKPFYCVVCPTPLPDDMFSPCALEFKCVKGSNYGKVRRVSDKRGVLQES